ncbi:sulfotransferase family 2 domain-containing protein [Pseudomonas putida]
MLQRFIWKLLPKNQRAFLLGRLSVVDRQAVNKSMSGSLGFPQPFADRDCLFIHVPKCAGSSVSTALFDGWFPGHIPLYWYEQQFPRQFASSYKFAFVRDPLERAYSAFAYLKGRPGNSRDGQAHAMVSRYSDFNTFVSHWLHADNLHKQIHFAPQTDFLVDSLGHLSMDFIGRQEHIQRDFGQLCERFGVASELPQINRSRHRVEAPAREFCSLRTRRLVRRAYQRDYELLGYE